MTLCYAIGIVHSGMRNTGYKDWYEGMEHLFFFLLFSFPLILVRFSFFLTLSDAASGPTFFCFYFSSQYRSG